MDEHWWLTNDELENIRSRSNRNRIGFAVLVKFFQVAGRFPKDRNEMPRLALEHLAKLLDAIQKAFAEYKLSGRSCERDLFIDPHLYISYRVLWQFLGHIGEFDLLF